MTTTVAPDPKPDRAESEEWPTLARDAADTTREEPDGHAFGPIGVPLVRGIRCVRDGDRHPIRT
jgi:hypothetical protein